MAVSLFSSAEPMQGLVFALYCMCCKLKDSSLYHTMLCIYMCVCVCVCVCMGVKNQDFVVC